jgi:hypothetical protein
MAFTDGPLPRGRKKRRDFASSHGRTAAETTPWHSSQIDRKLKINLVFVPSKEAGAEQAAPKADRQPASPRPGLMTDSDRQSRRFYSIAAVQTFFPHSITYKLLLAVVLLLHR